MCQVRIEALVRTGVLIGRDQRKPLQVLLLTVLVDRRLGGGQAAAGEGQECAGVLRRQIEPDGARAGRHPRVVDPAHVNTIRASRTSPTTGRTQVDRSGWPTGMPCRPELPREALSWTGTLWSMDSCQCDRIDSKFDEAYANEKLAEYRSAGPDPSTMALVEAIRAEDINGMTLLDIGGGVGAVQHALLEAGVSSVQEVEASEAYLAASKTEAERLGYADRISHLFGDFASVANEVEPADIVTLDRSMCCWHDMPDLVTRSSAKARRLYGLVYPRDVWWVRYGWRLFSNVRQLVKRSPLRVFTHRQRDVEAILFTAGFTVRTYREVGVWQVALYTRSGTDPSS